MKTLDDMEAALKSAPTVSGINLLMEQLEREVKKIALKLSQQDRARLNYLRNMARYQRSLLNYDEFMG